MTDERIAELLASLRKKEEENNELRAQVSSSKRYIRDLTDDEAEKKCG